MKHSSLSAAFFIVGVVLGVSLPMSAAPTKSIVPDGPRSIEILAIKPDTVISPTADDLFHGYPVKDRLKITDPDEIWAIVMSLNRDIVPHQPNIALFQPTYALIVTYKKKVHEYILCYECGQVQRWVKDASVTSPPSESSTTAASADGEGVPEPYSLQSQSTSKSSKTLIDGHLNDVHR